MEIATQLENVTPAPASRQRQPGTAGTAAPSPFALDVRFMTDTPPGHKLLACDCSDGCGTTCESACVTGEGF